MHELSIAMSIVEAVEESLPDDACRATVIKLRVGAMSGIFPDALLFGFEIAAEGTRSAGAGIEIETVPAVVRCAPCGVDTELESPPIFRCGKCGELTGNLLQGKELEIESIEVDDGKPENP
jgi:hydrogenase nickel incorporation protein HypA/HybF